MTSSTGVVVDVSLEPSVWIGIDLGTSNSACAVWDSTRGSPKWMRLPPHLAEVTAGGKWGRLIPSLVKISKTKSPLVGAEALEVSTGSLISSVKRLLGHQLPDLDPHWLESSVSAETSEFQVIEDEHGELQIVVKDYFDETTTIHITPVQVVAILLKSIREGAEKYLMKYANRKHLDIPQGPDTKDFEIRNAVIGVPAHFSKRQIALVEEAAHQAGLKRVSTCLESTAAAMAYGLTLQETSNDSNIMVVDMGGGTSDITIARKKKTQSSSGGSDDNNDASTAASYQVLVTIGEERLGGDDIDQAMVQYCLSQATSSASASMTALLKSCRKAKENLCDTESPSESETIRVPTTDGKNAEVTIDQEQFQRIIQPWVNKAQILTRRAMECFDKATRHDASEEIAEVILVGGSSRIPAVRRMIQAEFPKIEIGISVNPMSSVAQGLAIQAALVSQLVPTHELRSALMLDCIPHAIGVLLKSPEGTLDDLSTRFIEILSRNAPLPARGSATFTLANKRQPGVTIEAVEQVGDANGKSIYEPMAKEPFTFLLRRLTVEQLQGLNHRTIEVGMRVDTEGQFTVSIFDEMDPEHVLKRERHMKEGHTIGFENGDVRSMFRILWEDSGFTSDQMMLIGILVGTVVMYIAVKVAFSQELLVGN